MSIHEHKMPLPGQCCRFRSRPSPLGSRRVPSWLVLAEGRRRRCLRCRAAAFPPPLHCWAASNGQIWRWGGVAAVSAVKLPPSLPPPPLPRPSCRAVGQIWWRGDAATTFPPATAATFPPATAAPASPPTGPLLSNGSGEGLRRGTSRQAATSTAPDRDPKGRAQESQGEEKKRRKIEERK